MIWLNSIDELQYYNQSPLVPCYCSILYYANDAILQGSFTPGTGSYTLAIQTLSADGLTTYETSTSNFSYYFFVNPITNEHTFNARLNSFTSAMCTHACWILRVTVMNGSAVVFDKYTERYCQSSCCDTARNITFNDGTDDDTFTEFTPVLPPLVSGKVTECGEPLITLRSVHTCMDMDGNYYPIPDSTLSGSASFGYQKLVNMRGRIVKRPRNIERTYSFNCRLQRVESQRVYLFEGYEYFPAWASDEIETMLSATEIYVDNVRYEYSTGTPFEMASECKDVFRLKTTLSDCIQRQVLGCDPNCAPSNFDGAAKMYVIPSEYQGGYFYDENKALIAQDYDELLSYFRNLDGAYGVNEIATSPLSCETFGAFSLNTYGYVPGSFYYDMPINGNRVYAIRLDSADEICPTYGQTCAAPVITFNWVEEQICADPVITYYWVEDDMSETITITGHGDWSNDGTSEGTVVSGYATITIGVGNPFYVPGSPASPVFVNGEIIAVLSVEGRPLNSVFLDSSNSILPDDVSVSIEPNGFVRYYGEATELEEDQAKIIITNLTYNLQ